jgi:hypothetical protein
LRDWFRIKAEAQQNSLQERRNHNEAQDIRGSEWPCSVLH